MSRPASLLSLSALFGALAVCCTAPAALVGYWNFNEGTGTVAANSANASFPGTMVNYTSGSEWTAGPSGFGSATALDGVDDIVTTGYAGISGGAARSVAAWIRYPVQSQTDFDGILSYGNNTTGNRWTFRISDAAAVVANRLRLEISGAGVYGGTNLNDGLWHHVAVVQSGNTLASVQLYVDGIPETLFYNGTGSGAVVNTLVTGVNNVALGGSNHGTNYNFQGSLDEVRMYDSALTQAEVQALMIPEPGSAALLGGVLSLALLRRRR